MNPFGDYMPKVFRSSLQASGIIILCDDEETGSWLKDCFHDKREVINCATLKVMNASELPKPVKVAFKTKDTYTKEPVLLQKWLNQLNQS